MSREIKFRAWDLKRKKMGWVESLFCDYKNDTEKDDWICYTTDEMKIEERPCGDYREKQNVILMQYTGLKDKNGKEIYEGDLCKEFDKCGEIINSLLQIVWSDKYQYGVKVLKGGALSRNLTFPLWQWNGCEHNGNRQLEVVGNIYTTPELLKEE